MKSALPPYAQFLLLFTSAAAFVACGDNGTSASANGGAGGHGATGGNTNTAGSGGTGAATTEGGGGTGGSGGTTTSSTTTSSTTALCPPDPTGPVPPLKLTKVASGFELPVYLTFAPGDPTRQFVVEQTGRIQIIKNGSVQSTPFLDLSDVVQPVEFTGDERGLLGLAFHPDYPQNGRFFVHYTDNASDHGVVEEWHAMPGTDFADPIPKKTIYAVKETQYNTHNGGQLAFGPDGYLYIGFGDGGQTDDPNEKGEDVTSELGKILRIDPDTFPTPVPGNLQGGYPHIWDYGLRNPWRFSFDRCSSDMYIGDSGSGIWQEVNVEPKGQGHKNYGWDVAEGTHCHEPSVGCDLTGITMPLIEYSLQEGNGCAIIGGYVYRGSKVPNLVGTYFYADYCTRRVWTFRYQNGAAEQQLQLTQDLQTTGFANISSFGEDRDGELYILDRVGDIYLIEAE